MAITGFQIRKLTLVGRGVPNAEVQFHEGLNVVSGPSDTGKTFIVQCIDYMLGGKATPSRICVQPVRLVQTPARHAARSADRCRAASTA